MQGHSLIAAHMMLLVWNGKGVPDSASFTHALAALFASACSPSDRTLRRVDFAAAQWLSKSKAKRWCHLLVSPPQNALPSHHPLLYFFFSPSRADIALIGLAVMVSRNQSSTSSLFSPRFGPREDRLSRLGSKSHSQHERSRIRRKSRVASRFRSSTGPFFRRPGVMTLRHAFGYLASHWLILLRRCALTIEPSPKLTIFLQKKLRVREEPKKKSR